MTGPELRSFMKKHGLSQRDLARLLPLRTPNSTRIIRYWLSGEKPIRPLVEARIRALAAESARRRS